MSLSDQPFEEGLEGVRLAIARAALQAPAVELRQIAFHVQSSQCRHRHNTLPLQMSQEIMQIAHLPASCAQRQIMRRHADGLEACNALGEGCSHAIVRHDGLPTGL